VSAEIHCPQCQRPLTQVGKQWICPEHGQLGLGRSRREEAQTSPPPLAFSLRPLRISLSYGHDANEELVRRIYADLEKRIHDVWFDKNPEKEEGISPGDDWRRAITDGILQSNRILSFLSKNSTRDPGVCLDEITIAIGAKGGNKAGTDATNSLMSWPGVPGSFPTGLARSSPAGRKGRPRHQVSDWAKWRLAQIAI
jgi:hypothetical protein